MAREALFEEIATKVRTDLTDALDTHKYAKLDSYHKIHEIKAAELACSRATETSPCIA